MRILFIGCVISSYRLLKVLLENNCDVAGVITKEKSGFNADYYDLKPLCDEHKVSFFCVRNVNDGDSIKFIKDCKPDVGFCFGWSQLVKDKVIDLFPRGIVGFHPAALPYNRGRHPLIWALALGLDETASSFFMLDETADTGDIISQRMVHIEYEDDARSLYDKLLDIAVIQELEIVREIETGMVKRIQQPAGQGNSWRKRGKPDGQIDWRMSSRSIYNLVRSLTHPYVGSHFVYDGGEYKVWRVEEIEAIGLKNIEPGKVLAINSDGSLDVKTGEGAIRLIDFEQVTLNTGDYIL